MISKRERYLMQQAMDVAHSGETNVDEWLDTMCSDYHTIEMLVDSEADKAETTDGGE